MIGFIKIVRNFSEITDRRLTLEQLEELLHSLRDAIQGIRIEQAALALIDKFITQKIAISDPTNPILWKEFPEPKTDRYNEYPGTVLTNIEEVLFALDIFIELINMMAGYADTIGPDLIEGEEPSASLGYNILNRETAKVYDFFFLTELEKISRIEDPDMRIAEFALSRVGSAHIKSHPTGVRPPSRHSETEGGEADSHASSGARSIFDLNRIKDIYRIFLDSMVPVRLKLSLWFSERSSRSMFWESRSRALSRIKGCLHILGKGLYTKEREAAKNILIRLINDPIESIRDEAALLLARLGGLKDDFISGYRKGLDSPYASVCINAIKQLRVFNDKESLPKISKLFLAHNPQVRLEAITAAREFGVGDEELLEMLNRAYGATMVSEMRSFIRLQIDNINSLNEIPENGPSPEELSLLKEEMRRGLVDNADGLLFGNSLEFDYLEVRMCFGHIYPIFCKYFNYYNRLYEINQAPPTPDGIGVLWYRILGNHSIHNHTGKFTRETLDAYDEVGPILSDLRARMDKASFVRLILEIESRALNYWGMDNDPEMIRELGRLLSSRSMATEALSGKNGPPKGSLYSVFRELLSEDRPFTMEEIASRLGRRPSSMEPDIRALVYHLGLARIDVSQKGSPVFLTFEARRHASEISQVLERLHSQHGYRPKIDDIRRAEPEIRALFQIWPDEPTITGDLLEDISAWGSYINALFDMVSAIEPSRANLPKRYFERNIAYDRATKKSVASAANPGYFFKHGVSQPLLALMNARDFGDLKSGKRSKAFTLLPKAFQDVKILFELLEEISGEGPEFFRNLRQPSRHLGSMDRPFPKAALMNYVTKQVFGGTEGYRNLRILKDIVGRMRVGISELEKNVAMANTEMQQQAVYLSDDAINAFWLIDKHDKLGDRFTLHDYL
ncbi:MAG TPA: hypothetical protein PLV52_03750, partial [Candidatus Omnitrophota bacterium]|nr:hypothetical protein [Candidatus Omnitrophota bacterium]